MNTQQAWGLLVQVHYMSIDNVCHSLPYPLVYKYNPHNSLTHCKYNLHTQQRKEEDQTLEILLEALTKSARQLVLEMSVHDSQLDS